MLSDEDRHDGAEGQERPERHRRPTSRATAAIIATPTTAPAMKPKNSPGSTMPGFSQPRYMPSSGARRTSPSPMPPLLTV